MIERLILPALILIVVLAIVSARPEHGQVPSESCPGAMMRAATKFESTAAPLVADARPVGGWDRSGPLESRPAGVDSSGCIGSTSRGFHRRTSRGARTNTNLWLGR
jgi:hypothetical protein